MAQGPAQRVARWRQHFGTQLHGGPISFAQLQAKTSRGSPEALLTLGPSQRSLRMVPPMYFLRKRNSSKAPCKTYGEDALPSH
eukprot:9070750-Lingulodinium_polyedra.AAC.1